CSLAIRDLHSFPTRRSSDLVIVDFQHVKPGKGNQFSRTKLRNMLTGQNLEVTFKSGEKFEVPNVENKEMTFLYKDDSGYNFMSQDRKSTRLNSSHVKISYAV